jgi:hypothetical protein
MDQRSGRWRSDIAGGDRGFGEFFEIAGGNDFGPVLAITL